jgi:16S rRNA (guanine527-N7)-methyltransferase
VPILTEARIATLLRPYLEPEGAAAVPSSLYTQLSAYLDLLAKWNARTNLTAIREPEEMVRRHFGESLFAGLHLNNRLPARATVLDFGSGAGFPGLPIQLLAPELQVTLAESQGKKASFLQEVARTLSLKTEIWAGRVETMLAADGTPRRFDAITLRAVDNMQHALAEARKHVAPGGWLVTLSTETAPDAECIPLPGNAPGWVTFLQPTI